MMTADRKLGLTSSPAWSLSALKLKCCRAVAHLVQTSKRCNIEFLDLLCSWSAFKAVYLFHQQVQQQPKCSGRLRFEPLALSAANGGVSDLSIAAANAWIDIPEAGEAAAEQDSVGKAKFNLEYEKVGGCEPAGVRRLPSN